MKPHFIAPSPVINLILSLTASIGMNAAQPTSVRTVPARSIPTPTTVSPELQKVISPAWNGNNSTVPRTNEQWKALVRRTNENSKKSLDSMRKQFHVDAEGSPHKTCADERTLCR